MAPKEYVFPTALALIDATQIHTFEIDCLSWNHLPDATRAVFTSILQSVSTISIKNTNFSFINLCGPSLKHLQFGSPNRYPVSILDSELPQKTDRTAPLRIRTLVLDKKQDLDFVCDKKNRIDLSGLEALYTRQQDWFTEGLRSTCSTSLQTLCLNSKWIWDNVVHQLEPYPAPRLRELRIQGRSGTGYDIVDFGGNPLYNLIAFLQASLPLQNLEHIHICIRISDPSVPNDTSHPRWQTLDSFLFANAPRFRLLEIECTNLMPGTHSEVIERYKTWLPNLNDAGFLDVKETLTSSGRWNRGLSEVFSEFQSYRRLYYLNSVRCL
ncbi:hypothetical protein FA15DRAFT_667306 [Coprinopsis marcescibilis]|uniref:F-box domain-containing protein n=1 Tax=Coprinopsis marcescibilis TaxID=230819 RepID=A0A5C3L220_COPMA|nr:hypothetical protein FA15DRAFT_667306 [Coprinopsis marcescibilis]